MMKGLMDRCLSREKWVDCLKEKVEAIETDLNAWKEVQVKN